MNGLHVAGVFLAGAIMTPLIVKDQGGYMGNMNQAIIMLMFLSLSAGSAITWALSYL